jgi:hypothetical protein
VVRDDGRRDAATGRHRRAAARAARRDLADRTHDAPTDSTLETPEAAR